MDNVQRAELAKRMQGEGSSLVQIGIALGVSKQRVHQLLTSPPGKRIKVEPYQRNDPPDELNAIARTWRGPTNEGLRARL